MQEILRRVLHHTVTVRRQGTFSGAETREGKLLVLKKRFKNRNALDIWSSLLLSLPREEVELLLQLEERTDTSQGAETRTGNWQEAELGQPSISLETDTASCQEPQDYHDPKGNQDDPVPVEDQDCPGPGNDEDEDVFVVETSLDKSVRDLSRTFEEFAASSSVSLPDHVRRQEVGALIWLRIRPGSDNIPSNHENTKSNECSPE